MANYYYLVSSFVEADTLGRKAVPSVRETFLFCRDEVNAADFEKIRKLFLFNDIHNTVWFFFNEKKSNDDYWGPSYYDQTTFMENKKDPALFLPFIARFYEMRALDQRLYPELPHTDELTAYFYEDLDTLCDGFLADWYRFELDLRNFTIAMAHRQNGLPIAQKLIPFGTVWEHVRQNPDAADFGLADEFPAARKLLAQPDDVSLENRERLIETVRWEWLDERQGNDWFSIDAVLAYLVRLRSAERWRRLTVESGEEMFQNLMNTVARSIRFSIEFGTTEAHAS